MSNQVIEAAAKQYGTPFYLFDEGALRNHVAHLRSLFAPHVELCYAMKANSFVLQQAAREVERIEVCSPGEALTCLELDVPQEMIVISGVYKELALMRLLMSSYPKIGCYTVESPAQFELLSQVAREVGHPVNVLMRLTSGNQFGMTAAQIEELAPRCTTESGLTFRGIQFFSGTQKTSLKRLERELARIDKLIARLQESGTAVEELEFGPGLPVSYYDSAEEAAAQQDALAVGLNDLLANMAFAGRVILELGRGMVAGCGTYVTSIVDTKRNKTGNYAIVDGGKHQFVYYGNALSMKQPPCQLLPARTEGPREPWNICGALCTVTDIMVKQLEVCEPRLGDLLVFERAGAYCMSEGISLFLSRDLPAVIMRDTQGSLRLARDHTDTYPFNTPSASGR